MTVFFTKVWGSSFAEFPVFNFSHSSEIEKLRRSEQGSRCYLIGTKQAPTAPEHQDRIIGWVRWSNSTVDPEAVAEQVGFDLWATPENYTDDRYKFPYGLAVLEYHELTEHVLFSDFVAEWPGFRDGMANAVYARDPEEVIGTGAPQKFLALTTTEIPILECPIIGAEARKEEIRSFQDRIRSIIPGSQRRAPAPISNERVTFVYAFRLFLDDDDTGITKIGYSYDPAGRLKTLNKGIRPHLLNNLDLPILEYREWTDAVPFPSDVEAWNAEQYLHEEYSRDRITRDEEDFYGVREDELHLKLWDYRMENPPS